MISKNIILLSIAFIFIFTFDLSAKWFKLKQEIKTCNYSIEVKPKVYFIFSVDQVECNGIKHTGVIHGIRFIVINKNMEIISDADIHNDYLNEIEKRWPNLQKIEFKEF